MCILCIHTCTASTSSWSSFRGVLSGTMRQTTIVNTFLDNNDNEHFISDVTSRNSFWIGFQTHVWVEHDGYGVCAFYRVWCLNLWPFRSPPLATSGRGFGCLQNGVHSPGVSVPSPLPISSIRTSGTTDLQRLMRKQELCKTIRESCRSTRTKWNFVTTAGVQGMQAVYNFDLRMIFWENSRNEGNREMCG